MDEVQFDGRSWQQRNKIFENGKSTFITIPVIKKNLRFQKISNTKIDTSSNLDSFRALLNSEKQAMIKQWMNPTYDAMLFEKLAMNGEIDEALRIFEGLSIKQYELEIFL